MTKKAVQGRGIGSALIGELLNELRKADCKKARLAVDRGNPQSKAFWEKNGFALTGRGSAARRFGLSPDGKGNL